MNNTTVPASTLVVYSKQSIAGSLSMSELELSQLRKTYGLTQTDIASTLFVSQPTITKLERDTKNARISALKRYIEAIGGSAQLVINLPGDENLKIDL